MRLTHSRIIKAPIELVWTVISDLPLMGKLTPACTKIEIISKQTKGVGTQTRWYSTVHPDEPSTEEIIDWRPLESLTWVAYIDETPLMEGSLLIAPTPQGHTILTFSEDFLLAEVDLTQNELEMIREIESVKKYIEEKARKSAKK